MLKDVDITVRKKQHLTDFLRDAETGKGPDSDWKRAGVDQRPHHKGNSSSLRDNGERRQNPADVKGKKGKVRKSDESVSFLNRDRERHNNKKHA